MLQEPLRIKGAEFTPEISFSPDGELRLIGKSFWENSQGFYAPVLEWVDAYLKQPATKTVLTVQLDYFNTATAKVLMDMLKRFERARIEKSMDIEVHWMYLDMDEDLQEAGEEYASIVKIPFKLMPIPSK
jgi:hypothetical protein